MRHLHAFINTLLMHALAVPTKKQKTGTVREDKTYSPTASKHQLGLTLATVPLLNFSLAGSVR